ncbi:MAG: hypothetical protein QG635_1192 [Bacteroidota bacterium]|nr:hypothetical protein [Bacteroidota bacterium]
MNKKIFIYILILISSFSFGFGQKSGLPEDMQLPLFLKILTFDRNLNTRANKEFHFLIVYQKSYRSSYNSMMGIQSAAESHEVNTLNNLPLKFKTLSITREEELDSYLAGNKTGVVYFSLLRGLSIQKLSEICRKRKVLSITGVPEYIEDGFSISLDVQNDKPLIINDLKEAKAEGADFSSQLLKISKIIE